ncbi:MAG: peptide ABC transporter substrate-binding protein [Gaiellaceae bacterium]
MARALALAAAIAVSLLAVSGAGGAGTQTPKRGGTVVFGPVREPSCLTTFLIVCRGGGVVTYEWIAKKVLSPAFIVGSDGTPRPRLVSGVTYTTRPPFTLTYHIRPEARWSDGVPVTARDFVFTDKAIRRFAAPDSGELHLQVRSVREVDAKTVRVVLRSRLGSWRSLFWTLLPRHALLGEDLAGIWADGIDNPKTGGRIGSGPFLVERWERGKQLTLVRNLRYWGPHTAYLDRIVVRFCRRVCNAPPSDEVLERLRQGEVDFVYTRDAGTASELRRIGGVKVLSADTNGLEHLDVHIRSGHPALEDKLVRRALAYGIDRVAIVRRLLGEADPKYRVSDNAIFLPNSRHYQANWARYRYRPSLARRLLEQAGCGRGSDGIYACAGRQLSLRVRTSGGQPLRERTLELLQADLRQVGVEVVPLFGPGDSDLVLFTWFYGSEPSGLKDVFGCGGSLNFTGYCQRLVTRDLDQADRILDADQRARVLNRADRQLAKDVPIIPLYEAPILYAFRSTLRGVDPAPFDPFWNAEDWWLER